MRQMICSREFSETFLSKTQKHKGKYTFYHIEIKNCVDRSHN